MNNSLVHSLEGYIHALFNDLAWTYGKVSEMERDKNRSLHELAIRGERMFTIDLPAIRKHFEKCLEEGLYEPCGLYLSSRVSKTVQVPAFGRDLYLQIFDVDGKLRTDANPHAVFALRQLYEGWGKLKNECRKSAIRDEVKNFISNERDLRSPTLSWSADTLYEESAAYVSASFMDGFASNSASLHGEEDLFPEEHFDSALRKEDALTLQKVCDIISSSFGDFDSEEESEYISERPRHGSGRVSNLRSTESKFLFKDWPRKLDLVFPYDRYGVSDLGYSLHLDYHARGPRNSEAPSKLIAVPKTMSGPRLIGSEPNYHQWIQQLVRNQLENRVKASLLARCISFGDQRPNRRLALQGSLDGSIATVDLKSASDRLSCWTIERALRGNLTLLRRIHASRTRTMHNAIDDQFDRIILKKCFTQGSACTFPVQTIVYSMVCIAAVLISQGKRVSSRNIIEASALVRVFGDDIVVPVYALPKLREILSFLQLIVNSSKTFSKGRFRESCGLDAFAGVDVTPARVKRFSSNPSHEVAQSMIKASNNFFERGMWNVAMWLQSHLRTYEIPVNHLKKMVIREDSVGPIEELYDSEGFSSYSGADTSHLRSRWNKDLQRYEVRRHYLTTKSKKVSTQSAYDLSEFLFGKSTRVPHLEHLHPTQGGLGIVNKKASVMKLGWMALT